MERIVRQNYLNTLISLRDKNIIKILVGVRRCGKSTIMQSFREYLETQGVLQNQIVFLNFESIENNKWLNNFEGLYYHVINQLDLSKPCYVFLDEVQNVKEFERLIDGLFVKENVDVYVTGSNAYLLSSELGTLLTGRYISIPVYPFSFKEYVSAFDDKSRLDLLFTQYLQNGGMPALINFPASAVRDYIQDVVNNIIQKDVLVRHKWRNDEHFIKTTEFLFDTIGSTISVKKIANTLLSNGIKISHNTIGNYVEALTQAFLFYKVKRYDVKGKNLLATQEKYYTVDLAFKHHFLGGKENHDLGHNLENVVFLELLRRGNRVHIGKADNTEIDFVILTPNGGREYIQVAWTAKEQSTFGREMQPFEKIKDYNKRMLLTTDVEPVTSYKGIQKINVIDWLLA